MWWVPSVCGGFFFRRSFQRFAWAYQYLVLYLVIKAFCPSLVLQVTAAMIKAGNMQYVSQVSTEMINGGSVSQAGSVSIGQSANIITYSEINTVWFGLALPLQWSGSVLDNNVGSINVKGGWSGSCLASILNCNSGNCRLGPSWWLRAFWSSPILWSKLVLACWSPPRSRHLQAQLLMRKMKPWNLLPMSMKMKIPLCSPRRTIADL